MNTGRYIFDWEVGNAHRGSLRDGFRAVLLCLVVSMISDVVLAKPIVIAHRGASGYLPEHTLEAKALAHAMFADYIEQDVVATKDDQLVVLHDKHIDTVSDVAQKFPGRARVDKRYYAIDFTLAELKMLNITERQSLRNRRSVFPNRFPAWKSKFQIATLSEEIELIQGLNKSTRRYVGIYVEIKAPEFHKKNGKDISKLVIETLIKYGYDKPNKHRSYIQCFDAQELKRIRKEFKVNIPLVQLVGENEWKESDTDYNAMRTRDGIRDVKKYAKGIGFWIKQIYLGKNGATYKVAPVVKWAKAAGLVVHPYTFRKDALPEGIRNLDELHDLMLIKQRVDGVFTDFPDLTRKFVDKFF